MLEKRKGFPAVCRSWNISHKDYSGARGTFHTRTDLPLSSNRKITDEEYEKRMSAINWNDGYKSDVFDVVEVNCGGRKKYIYKPKAKENK